MKSGAAPSTPLSVRGAGLFDRIDYRLIETAEDKDHLYAMRYRAYLHGGLIVQSESQRVSDRYDDAPNAWTFGIYVDGELCSSLRLHVLTSEWRTSYAAELFGDEEASGVSTVGRDHALGRGPHPQAIGRHAAEDDGVHLGEEERHG